MASLWFGQRFWQEICTNTLDRMLYKIDGEAIFKKLLMSENDRCFMLESGNDPAKLVYWIKISFFIQE